VLADGKCDAVMIGRSAKANPWIFSWRERSDVTPAEVYGLIRYQFESMQAYYPEGRLLPFRKFLKAYLEPYGLPASTVAALLTCQEEAKFLERLDHLFLDLGVVDLNTAQQSFQKLMQSWLF